MTSGVDAKAVAQIQKSEILILTAGHGRKAAACLVAVH
jgi:hypothetical protein